MSEFKYVFSPTGDFKFKIKDGILINTYTQGLTFSNHLEFNRNVVVPNCVTELSKSAFSALPVMDSIFLPSSIENIQNGAFGRFCGDIILDDNFTAAIDDYGILYSPDMKILLKATIRAANINIIIPEGVEEVCDNAFDGINFKSVKLPNSLIRIGKNAFGDYRTCTGFNMYDTEYNSFDIYIPSNVSYIGSGAFQTYRIKNIIVSDENKRFKTISGILFTKNGKKLLHCPTGKQNIFNIPKETKKIDKFAFSWCQIDSVIIPSNDIELSYRFNCSKVKRIVLEDGIKSIPDSAFFFCELLEEIVIPASVTKIDKDAFNRSENIKIVSADNTFAISFAKENNIPYKII